MRLARRPQPATRAKRQVQAAVGETSRPHGPRGVPDLCGSKGPSGTPGPLKDSCSPLRDRGALRDIGGTRVRGLRGHYVCAPADQSDRDRSTRRHGCPSAAEAGQGTEGSPCDQGTGADPVVCRRGGVPDDGSPSTPLHPGRRDIQRRLRIGRLAKKAVPQDRLSPLEHLVEPGARRSPLARDGARRESRPQALSDHLHRAQLPDPVVPSVHPVDGPVSPQAANVAAGMP